ncbi:hypothetical protein [Methylotenera sp.]|uniref:hypothetical protein n=1 Tax=Methylotenera sp. TaxID=2051956 RepID=UPI002488C88D|nr:hypothetical protein [Methylotenera sp.]MDI1362505.1 hypothetical protein [Methylotenera sp.]
MIRKVFLYGGLAEEFTAEPLELAADTAPSLVLALRSIFPNWRAYLTEHPQIAFILSDENKENPVAIDAEMIDRQFGEASEVHIIPVQDGSLMAIPAIAAWVGESIVLAAVVNTISSMIITMALGAVFQALSPTPTTGKGSQHQVAQNQSFLYNGAENVQSQGGPVPLVYGYFMTGSTVISATVDVEQLLTTPSFSIPPANGGGTIQPTSPDPVSWQWTGL